MSDALARLVGREQAEIARYRDRLRQLTADPAYAMLRDINPAGATRSCWDHAWVALASAARGLDRWHDAVTEADGLLRSRPADLDRAGWLLTGRAVQLARAETPKEDRQPLLSLFSEPRFSLAYVENLVVGNLRTAQGVLDSVTAALATVRPRLDALAAGLDDAAVRLDPAEGDADRRELTGLRRGLYEARALIMADPLALEATGTAGSPGPAALARLDALETDLARLSDRLAQAAARDARRADQLAAQRQLIRARLDNARIRARRSGLADRPELTAVYQRARRLVEAVPWDVEQAEKAVLAYMERLDDLGPRPSYLGHRTI